MPPWGGLASRLLLIVWRGGQR